MTEEKNKPEKATSEENKLITIVGGLEMEVAKLDGSKELVKVRQIPISKFQSFVNVIGDPGKSIDLYCDRPPGWSDSLDLASAAAVLKEGRRINRPFFVAWSEDQTQWRDAQSFGAIGELQKKVETLVAALRSPSSAPASQRSTS